MVRKRRATKSSIGSDNMEVAKNDGENVNNSNNEGVKLQKVKKNDKPPPVVVSDVGNTLEFMKTLNKVIGKPIYMKYHVKNSQLLSPDSDSYRKVKDYCSKNNVPYHTFPLNEEKNLKIVIHGLSVYTNIEYINNELLNAGYSPIMTLQMKGPNGTVLPLFLTYLHRTKHNEGIYKLRFLGCCKISIKALKLKTTPKQCYRCQQFYHSSQFCTKPYKCLKCGESHATKDCVKPKDTPAKCANCMGEHTANYSGCPKRPPNRNTNEKSDEVGQRNQQTLSTTESYASEANANNVRSILNKLDPAKLEGVVHNIQTLLSELSNLSTALQHSFVKR